MIGFADRRLGQLGYTRRIKERAKGIEPSQPDRQPGSLPLRYARKDAGGRIRTDTKPGLSRSPLPRWVTPAIIGTGGEIRTLNDWFLRPAPLPNWATPAYEPGRIRTCEPLASDASALIR